MPIDLTESPGLQPCDSCSRIKPCGWFAFFWLCHECAREAAKMMGADALGRAIERIEEWEKAACCLRKSRGLK